MVQRHWWAWETLAELCSSQPEEAWLALLQVIELAENAERLEEIGAGPLEDLLRNHGERLIDRLESEAGGNDKLRTALASVWLPQSGTDLMGRLTALGCKLVGSSREPDA